MSRRICDYNFVKLHFNLSKLIACPIDFILKV